MSSGTGQRPRSHSSRSRSPARWAARLTYTVAVVPSSRHTVPAQLIQANSWRNAPPPVAARAAAATSSGSCMPVGESILIPVPSTVGVVNQQLPSTADAFRDASWADIEPYYRELAERPLSDENVEQWLADWSELESLVSEAGSLAYFAYSCNTADPALEAAQLRHDAEIGPKAQQARSRLQE